MKPNSDKCHLIVDSNDNYDYYSKSYIYLVNEFIENKNSVELLGVKIYIKFNFDEHITNLLNQKLHASLRISKLLREEKLKSIMKTFIKLQFHYCPLIWICHSRMLNNKGNVIHERAMVYKMMI